VATLNTLQEERCGGTQLCESVRIRRISPVPLCQKGTNVLIRIPWIWDFIEHQLYSTPMDLYAENILEHYRSPRGKKPINDGAWSVVHHEDNPSCGDELTIGLKVENGKITAVAWDGSGCAISQAAMSMLSEELIGKDIADAPGKKEVLELLGVPVSARRMKCAMLGLHTLLNAAKKIEGGKLNS
jgi:nitrogen fixation NifU-like protein